MFTLVKESLEFEALKEKLYRPEAGGVVCFEGRVRNHNHGRKVNKLNYEAFEEMAISEGNKILEEAILKFKVFEALAIHRIGNLQIGETAIWVGVCSSHREESFLACQFIIDQLKSRVPIWKKEFYEDGESEWVKCLACSQKGIPHSEHKHFHHVGK